MKIKYIALVGVLAYLISAGASASNKNELSQFMLECAQVNKDAKRLACFDRLVEDKVKFDKEITFFPVTSITTTLFN